MNQDDQDDVWGSGRWAKLWSLRRVCVKNHLLMFKNLGPKVRFGGPEYPCNDHVLKNWPCVCVKNHILMFKNLGPKMRFGGPEYPCNDHVLKSSCIKKAMY